MVTARLRRSGGSLIVAIPPAYIEQNQLDADSLVSLTIRGEQLSMRPRRSARSLAELLDATPEGEQRAEGWDTLRAVGAEQ